MGEKKVALLLEALKRERDAIFSGEFDAMDQVSREKSDLLDLLDFSTLSESVNLKVTYHLERNQKVLAAVIQGVKSAIRQLEDTPNGKGLTSVYTAWGAKAVMNESKSNKSKKY